MGQQNSGKSSRTRMILAALILATALLFLLGRESDDPPQVDDSPRAESAEGKGEDPAQSANAELPGETPAEQPSTGSQAPADGAKTAGRDAIANPGHLDNGDEIDAASAAEAARIDRAIRQALLIQKLDSGIQAARANPGLPPEALKGIRRSTPVPIEVQQAAEQVVVTPPEILEAMRPRETPEEITAALENAQERGTSDAMRAYMAGEGPRPEGEWD
jgi:hypothetical protein